MRDDICETQGGRFDDAIDRAVREMLDVEPPADLRARVIARIDRHAASGVRWVRLVAPVAAVGILVVAVLLWPSSRPASVVPAQSAQSAPAPLPTVSGHLASPPSTREAPETTLARVERARSPRRGSDAVAVAVTADRTQSIDVAPLDPIAPIRVAAVTQSNIRPQPIVIEPLAPIAEVQIAPLTPPDGRH